MGTCDSKTSESTSPPEVVKAEPTLADKGSHASLQSVSQRSIQRMGWRKDQPDHRDHHVTFKDVEPPQGTRKRMSASGEKEVVDLRPDEDFPVFNQGNLGSCTANALAAAFHFTVHKMTVEDHADFRDFTPSRLFIYYNERYVEGFVRWDIGGMLRDGIKTMARVGVCPEKVWTYENIGEKFKQEPDWFCYELAKTCEQCRLARNLKNKFHRGYPPGTQESVEPAGKIPPLTQELTQMKMCIANGYPFVFGFSVFPSFQTKEVASTGKTLALIGIAPRAVGATRHGDWRAARGLWGDKGYFYMPYAYICNPDLANDFWSIEWVKSFDNAGPNIM
ncbi:unnamed protein product [Symbiodinium microadriaticum]|nr:unnamed protein product [Symbiodinium microadriaticum]